jgi:hypothetical protein
MAERHLLRGLGMPSGHRLTCRNWNRFTAYKMQAWRQQQEFGRLTEACKVEYQYEIQNSEGGDGDA